MDEVETAAADTTSGSSPLAHSLQSLSSRHSSLLPSPPSPADAELPDGSDPRHQSSSFKRNHSGKMVPVGIAHPLQQRQSSDESSSDPSKLPRETVEHSDSSSLEAGPSKKPKLAEKSEDQMSDNEEIASKVLGFDLPGVDFLASNLSSSEEEEEVQDLFKFTPPSYSMEEARTEEDVVREEDEESMREEERGSQALPPGKEWHMFVTHSTSDIDTVSAEILEPMALEFPPRKVTASVHFRNSSQMYDNVAIKEAMRTSCVVLVAINVPYLDSSRCSKEWRLAVTLSSSCTVVVAAIGQCSRPVPLKCFLYLDFIDKHKRQIVWNKLGEVIDNTVIEHNPPTTQHLTTTSSQSAEARNITQNVFIEKDLDSEVYDIASSFESTVESLREKRKQQMALKEGERHGSTTSSRGETSTAVTVKVEEQEHRKMDDEGEVKGEVEEGEVKDSSSADEDSNAEGDNPAAGEVAKWYDGLAKPDADRRNESPIFHMRNFNNWVKSVLIREYLPKSATVLDLCCGKGGDLLKWKEGSIEYLACADISKTSVETCEQRYSTGRMLDRSRKPPFEAEFIVADCCEVRLRDMYENEARRFHITSCQFSLHYSFESYEKAHIMLQNACENLRPEGFFIGTTVDSYELIRRLRETEQGEDGRWCIGNNIYSVTMDSDPNDVPLFGAKYFFRLHGVVNLPEYVVHFPLLVRMLAEFDMELVLHQNFYDFFQENRHKSYNAQLICRMKAFNKKGTMSEDEWSAIGLYLVFVFRKVSK